ncbi:MAG TPA: glycosyltransferase family 9 protein [Burkholderiales bacterium]|nr:glycosyltransferase family 9 protein [Burkholderiales bacterium]
MKTVPRAILFRVGGLGDLLVALPAISLVRRSLPGFRLTLAGRTEYAGLLKHARVVDEVVPFDGPGMAAVFGRQAAARAGRDGGGGQGASSAGSLAGFELAMGWLNQRTEWPAERWWREHGVSHAFFVPYEAGADVPMSRFFFDRTAEHLRTMAAGPPIDPCGDRGGLFDECARLALGPDLIERALGSLGLRPLGAEERRLIVHPGSGGRAKRWPLRNFIAVVGHAAALGLEGVLVSGEAEADIEAEVARTPLPAGWSRATRLEPGTLAGLVAGSTHYVGNDSGPTHLAAACGASVVAIFRDENLPAWRPFGRTRVLSAPSVDGVALDAVLAALDVGLAARES